MTRNQMIVLVFAFVLGCIAGPMLVGRAMAQVAHANRPRFEYLCQPQIGRPWQPDDLQKLNQLGSQGWEMVQQLVGHQGMNGDVFCFKRQAP
jgi:hypothetical protein